MPPGDARYMATASMSIEGTQTATFFNTTLQSIDGHTFLQVRKNEILPIMTAYPGDRSVLLINNCREHLRHEI